MVYYRECLLSECGSKNVNMVKMFGLQLDGLSQSAQMNVGDLEEDFEELYDLYGDKMRMHPLVRIPMRTCFMVYMVHLTNQMAMKAPVPNMPGDPEAEPRYCPSDGCASHAEPDPAVPPAGPGESAAAAECHTYPMFPQPQQQQQQQQQSPILSRV